MRILETEHLTREFGGVIAVNDVDFHVEKGLVTGLIGPNGAGKTTLFNQITGMDKPTSGRIIFDGQDITGLPAWKISRMGIARTFQNIRLYKELTVVENVMMGLHFKVGSDPEHAQDFAGSLPYGKQRELEIARALSAEPKLLFLDEPAAGMNPAETSHLMGVVDKIRSLGVTVVLIEHDMKLVMNICDNITVLNFGMKIAEGTPNEIKHDKGVIEAYLGKDEEEDF